MQISKGQFEAELSGLINAALGANSTETAKSYLKEALHKIDGYDNIPSSLARDYRNMIYDAADRLGISI